MTGIYLKGFLLHSSANECVQQEHDNDLHGDEGGQAATHGLVEGLVKLNLRNLLGS